MIFSCWVEDAAAAHLRSRSLCSKDVPGPSKPTPSKEELRAARAPSGSPGCAEPFHQPISEFTAFGESVGLDSLIPAMRAHVFQVKKV
jgi:hypothetical protein